MIVFGTGTGRCGTVTLANLIDSEDRTLGLHEGIQRAGVEEVAARLPFLTLENVRAYHHPEQAEAMFRQARSCLDDLMRQHDVDRLVDIAYNNAPFVSVIPTVFPDAKLIYIYRDGRDFVRSANNAEGPDLMPAGWPDPSKVLTKRERYVGLGRLRPKDSELPDHPWGSMTVLERNAWLWAETNRIILEGINAWQPDLVYSIRFENFFANPIDGYRDLRAFLGLADAPLPDGVREILERPLNSRKAYPLPHWSAWTDDQNAQFFKHAGKMMRELSYSE